jgi:hypothetical protein
MRTGFQPGRFDLYDYLADVSGSTMLMFGGWGKIRPHELKFFF